VYFSAPKDCDANVLSAEAQPIIMTKVICSKEKGLWWKKSVWGCVVFSRVETLSVHQRVLHVTRLEPLASSDLSF
jgi:hypothetical protein